MVERAEKSAASGEQASSQPDWVNELMRRPDNSTSKACPSSPEYEQYMILALANHIDPAPLLGVHNLFHKYDCQIKTSQDAIDAANKTLSVLGDRFTSVMPPINSRVPGIQNIFDRARRGVEHGTGIDYSRSVDQSGQNYWRSNFNAPMRVTAIDRQSPASKLDIQPGDLITQINGENVVGMNVYKGVSALNGDPGPAIDLTVQRGDQTLHRSVDREEYKKPAVSERTLPNGITYIKIDNFDDKNLVPELEAAMRSGSTSGYVIDLRSNWGGNRDNALRAAGLFLDQGKLASVRSREASDPRSPQYKSTEWVLSGNRILSQDADHAAGTRPTLLVDNVDRNLSGGRPVVILTDRYTASAAELFSGAVHDNGQAVLVGQNTRGKGIGQEVITLSSGVAEEITSFQYLTPDGRFVGDPNHHKDSDGLPADVKVASSAPDSIPLSSEDTQFQKGLEVLQQAIDRNRQQ